MLGISLHLCNFSAWHIVGSTAIPEGTPHTWGAQGTVATCTVQGINVHISTFSVGFYYMVLSLYSFVAVRHNFVSEHYVWIEPWMHVLVHIFPVASAIYLASQQAFNNGGNSAVCWIDSLPNGCGTDDKIECTRGPQNINQVSMFTAGAPILLILISPTIIMVCLYRSVRSRQSTMILAARNVAQQSTFYLLALYWSFAFPLINNSLIKFLDKELFFASYLSNVNVNLLGVWMLLIYRRFSLSPGNIPPNNSNTSLTGLPPPEVNDEKRNITMTHSEGRVQEQPTNRPFSSESPQERRRPRVVEFNIFDGSNPTGQFADFVFEGDSDDVAADAAETQKWSDTQEDVKHTSNLEAE
jgi:hypothetical protein